MGNQTFQHGLKVKQSPESERLPRSPVRSRLVLLVKLAQQPLFFWGSLWIAALMLIGLALGALLDPAFVSPQAIQSPAKQPIQTVTPSENATTSTPNETTVAVSPPAAAASLWSLGAIALSCTVSSMLLAQWFNRSAKVQRFTDKAVDPFSVNPAAIQPIQPSHPVSSPIELMRPSPIADYQMPPALKSSASSNGVRIGSSSQKALSGHPIPGRSVDLPDVAEAIVTLVPSDQSHPLDWDEDSLVNAMDIRKRHPLSSWI